MQLHAVHCNTCHTTCRKEREQQQRAYTKAVLAEWKANKAAEQQAAKDAAAARKREATAQERQQRQARQQQLKAEIHARRQQKQQAQELQAARAPLQVAPAAQQRPRPHTATSAGKLSAQRQAALQERSQQMLQRRQAALQAKHQQAEQRTRAQQKLLANVRACAVLWPAPRRLSVWTDPLLP